jgi:hypothetical protein
MSFSITNELELFIEQSIEDANAGVSKLSKDVLSIDGMSGVAARHFYNNICSRDDTRYLEIGTWKGSSLCSAIYGNKVRSVCIDDWASFDGPRDEFHANLDRFRGESKVYFAEINCWKVDVNKLPFRFNVYLYDADHLRINHRLALVHFYSCLDERFIYLVDDWNWLSVQVGTYDGIKECNLKIIWKKEIITITDQERSKERSKQCCQPWWNGIGIFILEKQ